MNIRRWLLHRGPLIVATLAITAVAAVIAPAPASASVANVFCSFRPSGPNNYTNPAVVSAETWVSCNGFAESVYASVDLARDGQIVASNYAFGSLGALAFASTNCVPGYYVAYWYGSVLYPFGNIPGSETFRLQSQSTYVNCIAPPVPLAVANPGNQHSFILDSAHLQMTVSGGTAPYTWSATGLPTGLSINSSTGLITGTATRLGSYAVTVTATDAAGRSGSAQFTWAVRREPCPRC
jgi:hypothetical protein